MANQDAISLIKKRAGGNVDKKPENILCPMCGKPLVKKMIPGKGQGYVHEKAAARCKARYKSLEEIEAAREKKETKEERKPKGKANKNAAKEERKNQSSQVEITHTITKAEYEAGYFPEAGSVKPPAMENKQLIEIEKPKAEDAPAPEPEKEQEKYTPQVKLEEKPEKTEVRKKVPVVLEIEEDDEEYGETEKLRKEPRMKQLDKSMKLPTTVSSQEPKEMRATIIKKVITYDSAGPDAGQNKGSENRLEENLPQVENKEHKTAEELEYESYGKTQLLSIPAGERECPTLVDKDTGEIIEINQPVFLIGKTSKCQLRLEDNQAVSRKHAEILLKNDTVYVKDKGSANGTFINRLKLPEDTEVELKDGQELKVANVVYIFNK